MACVSFRYSHMWMRTCVHVYWLAQASHSKKWKNSPISSALPNTRNLSRTCTRPTLPHACRTIAALRLKLNWTICTTWAFRGPRSNGAFQSRRSLTKSTWCECEEDEEQRNKASFYFHAFIDDDDDNGLVLSTLLLSSSSALSGEIWIAWNLFVT